ncbi:hypothetical protein CO2235_150093 [Cupriavidus oxalaticus]|uniref:Uncharacterized protein n=1 Tax=Cupriavidus oxalaticus TaxID=96344 RepID=A0A375FN84_9BURK|nr:hypothetical protein CO2235_U600026 [Cupriavidus oxalaticus]SPC12438.1 hypothetical protein CO2235_150093 [Cupriavidus oxalaticus]
MNSLASSSNRKNECRSIVRSFRGDRAKPGADYAARRWRGCTPAGSAFAALTSYAIKALYGAKWHLWHGGPHPALRRLENLSSELDPEASPCND